MDDLTLKQLEASVRLNEAILNFVQLATWTPAMGAMLVNGAQPVVGCTGIPSNAPRLGSPADLARVDQMARARRLLAKWHSVHEDDPQPLEVTPLDFLEWCKEHYLWASDLEYLEHFLMLYRPMTDTPYALPSDMAQHALKMAHAVEVIKDKASTSKQKQRVDVTMPFGTPQTLTTEELAQTLGVQPQTIRKQHAENGSYLGIRPTKLPNRRLRWPADAVKTLLNGRKHHGS